MFNLRAHFFRYPGFSKIGTRISLLLTLFLGLVVIFILGFFPMKFEQQAMKAISDQAVTIASMTAYSLSPALYFGDTKTIQENLNTALQIRDIAYIVVVSDSGMVAAHNLQVAQKAHFHENPYQNPDTPDGQIYRVMAPIELNGQQIGELFLGLMLIDLQAEVVKSRSTILLVSLVIFTIGVIIVFSVTSFVIRPLGRMVATVEQVTAGDFSQRVDIYSNDEVGHLAHSFNIMVQELEAYTEKLKDEIVLRKNAEESVLKLNQELEQRVRERTAQLEATNKELEGFVYSISHDLRAPLRHIVGFIDLLKKQIYDTLDATGQRYINNIRNATSRLGNLIDDLLLYSRIGRAEIKKLNIDLNALVQDLIKGEFSAETRTGKISWNIHPLAQVLGDKNLIQQALINLMDNAIKFSRSRDQSVIEIGSQEDASHEVIIYIRDNGVGFDQNYAAKLFGVFQRLHHAAEFEGTGIGLANVKRIIELHGGRVWAEGEIDQGATFYFSLPKGDN